MIPTVKPLNGSSFSRFTNTSITFEGVNSLEPIPKRPPTINGAFSLP